MKRLAKRSRSAPTQLLLLSVLAATAISTPGASRSAAAANAPKCLPSVASVFLTLRLWSSAAVGVGAPATKCQPGYKLCAAMAPQDEGFTVSSSTKTLDGEYRRVIPSHGEGCEEYDKRPVYYRGGGVSDLALFRFQEDWYLGKMTADCEVEQILAFSEPQGACLDRPDDVACSGKWKLFDTDLEVEEADQGTCNDRAVSSDPYLVVVSTFRCSDGTKARRTADKCTILPGHRVSTFEGKDGKSAIPCTPVANQHPTQSGLTCTNDSDSRVSLCASGYVLCKSAAQLSFRVSGT